MPPRINPHSTTPSREPLVDLLRIASVLFTVLYHYTTHFRLIYPQAAPSGVTMARRLGTLSVFVLSGYVIALVAQREKEPARFLAGRLRRLLPTFWICCTVTFVAVVAAGLPGRETTFREYLLNLTMLHKRLGIRPVDGTYWSLEPILMFYAIVALALALKLGSKVCAIVAALVVCNMVSLDAEPWCPRLDFWSCFLVGMTLCAARSGWNARHVGLLAIAGADVVLSASRMPTAPHAMPVLNITAMCVIGLVLGLAPRVRIPLGASKVLARLAGWSFAWFLIHENIGYVILLAGDARGISPWAAIACATCFTLALAWGVTGIADRIARWCSHAVREER